MPRPTFRYIIGSLQPGADGVERGESQDDDSRRARELALAAYGRMTEGGAAGAGYETRAFPPPGHGPRRQLS